MSNDMNKNLSKAFSAESKASIRTVAFALKAEHEGYPDMARLFRAVADAQSVHARRFLYLMRGKIGGTEENLEAALQDEAEVTKELYPDMVQAAKSASKAVKKAFSQSLHTDAEHAKLYENKRTDLSSPSESEYYVCQICGHIHMGFVPENCPVCHAVSGRFKKVP